jgi:uncharacterized membrane protein YhhN
LSLAWLTFTVIMVAALVGSEARAWRTGSCVFKPLASVGFLAAAISADAARTPFGHAIIAGLVLSAVGDVMLLLHVSRAFMAGLGSFLLAHVAYAAAFVLSGVPLDALVLALCGLLPMAVAVGRWLLPHVKRNMRAPVLAYLVVITAMVALAAACSGKTGLWTLIAAAAFYLSDLSVARDRFVQRAFVNRAWGLPVYYAAQLIFALGAGFAPP